MNQALSTSADYRTLLDNMTALFTVCQNMGMSQDDKRELFEAIAVDNMLLILTHSTGAHSRAFDFGHSGDCGRDNLPGLAWQSLMIDIADENDMDWMLMIDA